VFQAVVERDFFFFFFSTFVGCFFFLYILI